MTLQELINAVMLKATGKATVLLPTNAKWTKIRGIANYYQSAWQNEPGQHWSSLYEPNRAIGTVSTKDTYDLDDDITEISAAAGNDVHIVTPTGSRINFTTVPFDDLPNYNGNYCAKIGQTLVFAHAFSEDDPAYGGKIYAPVFHKLEDLEDGDDDVLVDDPYWLVTITAAEYIRNDIVKQNQYGNLIAEANNLMQNMIRRNRNGQVKRVRGNWRNGGGM